MLLQLAALPAAQPFGVDVVDVDQDPGIRARFGHKIPVLLFAQELVCTDVWTPQRYIRLSRTIAARYNCEFVQA